MREDFFSISKQKYDIEDVANAKARGVQILPVLDDSRRIVQLINFSSYKSYLPLTAIIMAGGEGIRLRPLTEKLPKPLLKIGGKPIIEYGIDWMMKHGIEEIKISVHYLADKVIGYLGDGHSRGLSISYIHEKSKMGTIGCLSMIEDIRHDHVLIMNSDLLTNIDLEGFFRLHLSKSADMSIACIPYDIAIPYAILDTNHEDVLGLKEKPTITYHSNAGIYLIKKSHLCMIPKDSLFNATDLIDALITAGKKVIHYPILGYWLDIGRMDDFTKAQEDINYINF